MRNIWATSSYIFRPTASGLWLYGLYSEDPIQFIYYEDGFNSVWANDEYAYLATTYSGILRSPISTISGAHYSFETYKEYPDLSSNNTQYVHGAGDYLCALTESGIDRYTISTGAIESQSTTNAGKCYQTSNGDYYYSVNLGLPIENLDDSLFSWEYVREITLESGILEDEYNMLIQIPLTQPDDIYKHSNTNGIDVRFIDDTGHRVPYCIETWEYITPPEIGVTLSSGTNKLYVIYGNRAVADNSEVISSYAPDPPSYVVGRGKDIKEVLLPTELHVVYEEGGGYTYTSENSGVIDASYINDIFVTENTSAYGGNVIFLGTSWGAKVIEEKRGDEENCPHHTYLVET